MVNGTKRMLRPMRARFLKTCSPKETGLGIFVSVLQSVVFTDGMDPKERNAEGFLPFRGRAGERDALLKKKPKTITTTTTTFVVYFDLVTPSIVLKVTQNGNDIRGNLGIRGFFSRETKYYLVERDKETKKAICR